MSNQYWCNLKHIVTRWAQNVVPKAQKVFLNSKFQHMLLLPRFWFLFFPACPLEFFLKINQQTQTCCTRCFLTSLEILQDTESLSLNQLMWNLSQISCSFSWLSFMHLISNPCTECRSSTCFFKTVWPNQRHFWSMLIRINIIWTC